MNRIIYISIMIFLVSSWFINIYIALVNPVFLFFALLFSEMITRYLRRKYIGLKGYALLFTKKYLQELKLMYTAP